MKSFALALAAVVVTTMVAGSASAQVVPGTDTASGTVQAAVTGRCVIGTPFAITVENDGAGNYDVFAATDATGNDTIAYRCTKGVSTNKIYLGANSGAMKGPQPSTSDNLNFTLYSDVAMATSFPTTFAGGIVGAGSAGVLAGFTVPVYAKAIKNQDVTAGTYLATVVVNLEW